MSDGPITDSGGQILRHLPTMEVHAYISTPACDTMPAYAHLPGSSSSSPGMLHSYAEPDMSPESNFNSWPSFWYSPQQLSKARAATALNPKATHWTTSDVATPSSASSYSIPTPLSAMGHFDVADPVAQKEADFDEFDYDDDDEDDECVNFEDAMMSSEEDPNELTHTSPNLRKHRSPTPISTIKATATRHRMSLSDRKMSASAPGYPSTSHHTLAVDEAQAWFQREQLSHSNEVFLETPHLQPPQHIYSDLGISSHPIEIPSDVALRYQPSYYSAISCTNSSYPIPIMQPQPIRPIPPIPLDDFTSTAIENNPSDPCLSSQRPQTLSPLPLLCQPVSDAVRYQLRNSTSTTPCSVDPECYGDDDEDASEEACQSLCIDQEQPMSQSVAACSAHGLMYSRDCRSMATRWH
ncbi:hypothetical protein EDC04DRAFT_2597252 [Pisolithus marmoratus]|nr:hypothetical protein EDC04DRAFT_2597252 [Pisolithus marmoratus]